MTKANASRKNNTYKHKPMMRFLLTTLAFLLLSSSFAQQTDEELASLMTYMKRAMLFNQSLPQEKVYLHFDNTGYFMGETIWFKAYVVRADNQCPTSMSRVLYVELVNPSGDVVETRKLAVNGNGIAYGDIKLDSIYGTGFYEVRAYTRYMTNWGNGGIFSRVFPIFKAPKTEGDYSQMLMDEYGYRKRLPNLRDTSEDADGEEGRLRIRFYPEGGHFIKGVPCRVAFYVTDKSGQYVEAGGMLLDQHKQATDAVNTMREGRGLFQFTPDGERHYLRLSDEKGRQYDFLLPEAEEEGVALQLNMLDDHEISALMYSSPGLQGRLLGYTIMHNGRTLRADTVYAEPAQLLTFSREKLPAGVSQLTVFTSDGQIRAERLFFICPPRNAEDSVRITSPQMFPKPCGKVTIDIQTRPKALLSLSVMDAATMVNGAEGNAQTYMLLSSELKGYISDPGYYFEADDRRHRMDADLLMMVQGWRRYDWAMMAGLTEKDENKETVRTSFLPEGPLGFNQPVEDKLYIYGQLKQKRKKNSVANVWLDVNLYNNQGYHFKGTAKTDSLGYYAFSMPDVAGEYKMLINTGVADKDGYWKDVNYYVGIDRHFSPPRRLLSPQETTSLALLKSNLFHTERSKKAAAEDQEYIPINKKEHVLPTVVVKAKRKSIFENARAAWASEKEAQHYASLYYNADEDADRYADQGEEMPTVYQWLARRNPFFGGTDMLGQLEENVSMESTDESVFGNMEDVFTMGGEEGAEPTNEQATEMDNDASESNSQEFENTAKQPRIYTDGLGYKNRPIVWVLDNDYASISRFTGQIQGMFEVHRPTNQDMPIFLDEIKAVYISENPNAFRNCLLCPDLQGHNPVTVFLYTHISFAVKAKGMRVTHFQGYNEPSTFQMEDYGTLPPVEDFRCTIFWAPDVYTDETGYAQVEFWNNSSCKEMRVSCEGMTGDGRMLVNE